MTSETFVQAALRRIAELSGENAAAVMPLVDVLMRRSRLDPPESEAIADMQALSAQIVDYEGQLVELRGLLKFAELQVEAELSRQ